MNKLIKYTKFIALLFLISLYGCNDFQNNSFNIVFGADTYSLGKNRIIFSAIENVDTNLNNDFRVEINNVDSNANSESFVIKPNFYTWPNKNTGFYAFDYVFKIQGEYKINVYEWDGAKCMGLSGHVVGVDFPKKYSEVSSSSKEGSVFLLS